MRSHRFINSLLYLMIQLVAKESRANENNGGIRCLFVLFIDKRYISRDVLLTGPYVTRVDHTTLEPNLTYLFVLFVFNLFCVGLSGILATES